MATIVSGYNNTALMLGQGLLDLENTILKVMLLGDTYVPDVVNDTIYADISTHEINSATYLNYSIGGKLVTGKSYSLSGGTGVLDGDDVVWAGASITSRYAALYVAETLGAFVNPLLYYILFDDTPANVSRADFTIKWSTNGVLTIPKSA